MPRTPEATRTTPETQAVPKLYGFEDAINSLGAESIDDIIYGQVKGAVRATGTTPGSAGVNLDQATKQTHGVLNKYKDIGDRAFAAAEKANSRKLVGIRGRKIENLNMAESALPGTAGLMQMVRNKLDERFTNPNFNPNLSNDEQVLVEAVEWSALREERLFMTDEVTHRDYNGSPHGAPYDTYENAEEDAIYGANGLHTQTEWLAAEARFKGDVVLADDLDKVAADLDMYSDAYREVPPLISINRNAAKDYADELNKATPDPVLLNTLKDAAEKQADIDRVFATYDGQIKGHMKAELDSQDMDLRDRLTVGLENMQDVIDPRTGKHTGIAADTARELRSKGRMFSAHPDHVARQLDYDNACIELGRQELRVAQRIGVGAPADSEKLPKSGPQTDLFLHTAHINRSKVLDEKILRCQKENRTLGDWAADSWHGKRIDGSKENRASVNFLRRLAKVTTYTVLAATGPAGIAIAGGVAVGGRIWSKKTSEHALELRTRDMNSIVNSNDLLRISSNATLSDLRKMQAMRYLERERRNVDKKSHKRRSQVYLLGAAAAGAAVGFSPVLVPVVSGIGSGIAHNVLDITKSTGNASYDAAKNGW